MSASTKTREERVYIMPDYRIAIIPGDGVGEEVSAEAVKVLKAVAQKHGFGLETESFPWSCEHYLRHGVMMPENGLEALKGFDAIFLGCIGDAAKVPDHISITLILQLRKGFEQYINLRPIKLYAGVDSPVKSATPESVDMIVVRENTEGEYAAMGGLFKKDSPDGFALQTGVFTRQGCERAMRYAFELARSRRKYPDREQPGMVTNCTKSNALNYSMVFWDSVYHSVARDYSDIQTDSALVDALTMWMVKNPGYFDVIVASNLFGDIITDLGAMIQGGMGLAAGGNINPEKNFPSMFEPIHGSAPKYRGQGVINPLASVESVRMMLEHLGEQEAATDLQRAVQRLLSEKKVRTRDLGGSHSTREVGDELVRLLAS